MKNDWVSEVFKDLEELEIYMTEIEIEKMSKHKFKRLCKIKVQNFALKYLEMKKPKHELKKN